MPRLFSDCSKCCDGDGGQQQHSHRNAEAAYAAAMTNANAPDQSGSPFQMQGGVPQGASPHHVLQPLIQEKTIEVPKYEMAEEIVEVPQIQYVERVVEIPQVVTEEKIVHVAKPIIHERVKHVPKIVVEEKIIEVPQVQVVEKVVEVPQYTYQEKIIEVPKVIVQERVIPIHKKVIKEKLVEISEVQYKDIAEEKPMEEKTEEILYERETVEEIQNPLANEKFIEVPHVQHSYRNIMTPQYRHIPTPVEVPMTHYRPMPVEKIVDRNVPVPVELQIVQEYLCPKIQPMEVLVPIQVQRTIEHPVPKEAMGNPQLLPLYYQAEEAGKWGKEAECMGRPCAMSCFPCGGSGEAEFSQFNQPYVEVLTQGGYPQPPPFPNATISGGASGYGMAGVNDLGLPEGKHSVEGAEIGGDGQMHMGMTTINPGPYVQVHVTPQAPGQSTIIETTA